MDETDGKGIHSGHREKMRRRFLTSSLDSFASHEALELLLYYAIGRRDTNPIAHALMDHYGSLEAVFAAPVEDLMKVKGIGETSAILLKLVPQLVRKARLERVKVGDTILNDSKDAGSFLLDLFEGEMAETVYQLCLDGKKRLLSYRRLTNGGISAVDLDIRQLASNALLCGASQVILAHNHPSGLAVPSEADNAATEQIRYALKALGVELVDHIIIADGDYVSLRDSGFFNRP